MRLLCPSLKAADETTKAARCAMQRVGKTMQRQQLQTKMGKKRKRKEQSNKAESENEAKKRNQRAEGQWSGVIKNNDHFAISWQITIHQIVQITDISQ